MLCTELTAVQSLPFEKIAKPLHCRCWTCPHCAPMRKRELLHLARAGAPSLFITLTSKPHPEKTPDQQACGLVKALRKVLRAARTEAKRDPKKRPRPHGVRLDPERAGARDGVFPRQVRLQGDTLPFLAVFEKTKRGEPHLHIVARAEWISQEWLSKTMEKLTGAPVVWVEAAEDARKLANYISKYIAKDPHHFEGTKRYWRSKDWVLKTDDEEEAEDEQEHPWFIADHRWDHYLNIMRRKGYTVVVQGTIARISPPGGGPPG